MKDIIQRRLSKYNCQSSEEEEHAVREISQEIALLGLAKSNFFEQATFQGGTALRVVHGLPRFSEDLDFVLRAPRDSFELDPYLDKAMKQMANFGFEARISEKDKSDSVIQKRFLKNDGLKRWLSFQHTIDPRKVIKIKIEVDTNPPQGDEIEQAFLDFPIDFSIMVHSLGSLLAGKCHALLCREYIKGRDWFDFSWYCSQKVVPNYALLSSAIQQQGPWKGKNEKIDEVWLKTKLMQKIEEINWKQASEEVAPFLHHEHRETTRLWSVAFFRSKIKKLFGT